jgi:L-seryl-tRNA(Ser) seleniumtransferase
MTKAFEYPNPVHPTYGYALGTVLTDDVKLGQLVQRSKEALAERYAKGGIESVYSFVMNTDDCRTGDYYDGDDRKERYLGESLVYRDLDALAKLQLGGGPEHAVLAFNRMVAANATAVIALAKRGTKVAYLVPRYEHSGTMLGAGHPSIPRGIELAGCTCQTITSVQEFRAACAAGDVTLLGICAYYRDIIPEEVLREACREAQSRGIPVLVDDAAGARARIYEHGQRHALELGADVVTTSTDKYGYRGPRAAVMVGRRDLIDRIRAAALHLGTEARPSIVAAICRTIAEFTPEKMMEFNRELFEYHQELHAKAVRVFGPRLKDKKADGVWMSPEDFIEVVMTKAGVRSVDVAPSDVTSTHAAIALRKHGYLLLAGFSYPGASRDIWLHLNHKRSRSLNLDTVVDNLGEAVEETAAIVASRAKVQEILLG